MKFKIKKEALAPFFWQPLKRCSRRIYEFIVWIIRGGVSPANESLRGVITSWRVLKRVMTNRFVKNNHTQIQLRGQTHNVSVSHGIFNTPIVWIEK